MYLLEGSSSSEPYTNFVIPIAGRDGVQDGFEWGKYLRRILCNISPVSPRDWPMSMETVCCQGSTTHAQRQFPGLHPPHSELPASLSGDQKRPDQLAGSALTRGAMFVFRSPG